MPSDGGGVARQNVPSIFAHPIPQCVESRYDSARRALAEAGRVAVVCEPQPAITVTNVSANGPRSLIHPHYATRS